jgi:hypothetical protein
MGTPGIRRIGVCYIYGSIHVEIPRVDLLEKLVGRVSYVLLEGVRSSGLWRLVRRHPSLAPGILLLRFYLWLTGLHARLKGWRRGVEFAGDMEYVAAFFRRRDPQVRVEVVDASLGELVEVGRGVFLRLTASAMVIKATFALLLVHLVLTMTQPNVLLSATIIGICGFLFIVFAAILAPASVKALHYQLSPIRDRKLIDRVVELASGGHGVLIVRGKKHVGYIVEELRRQGVACEILNPE